MRSAAAHLVGKAEAEWIRVARGLARAGETSSIADELGLVAALMHRDALVSFARCLGHCAREAARLSTREREELELLLAVAFEFAGRVAKGEPNDSAVDLNARRLLAVESDVSSVISAGPTEAWAEMADLATKLGIEAARLGTAGRRLASFSERLLLSSIERMLVPVDRAVIDGALAQRPSTAVRVVTKLEGITAAPLSCDIARELVGRSIRKLTASEAGAVLVQVVGSTSSDTLSLWVRIEGTKSDGAPLVISELLPDAARSAWSGLLEATTTRTHVSPEGKISVEFGIPRLPITEELLLVEVQGLPFPLALPVAEPSYPNPHEPAIDLAEMFDQASTEQRVVFAYDIGGEILNFGLMTEPRRVRAVSPARMSSSHPLGRVALWNETLILALESLALVRWVQLAGRQAPASVTRRPSTGSSVVLSLIDPLLRSELVTMLEAAGLMVVLVGEADSVVDTIVAVRPRAVVVDGAMLRTRCASQVIEAADVHGAKLIALGTSPSDPRAKFVKRSASGAVDSNALFEALGV